MVEPPDPVFPVDAVRAAAQLGRTVSLALTQSELTPAGYRLLAYLATGETASKVLAAKLAVSRPTVTATLDWLEPRGYVRRSPDPADRRKVEITITAKGRRALEEADGHIVTRLRRVTTDLRDEQITQIVAALRDLGTALNAYRARGVNPETGAMTDPAA